MNTLYIECKMGIAGDMLTAALISLFDDMEQKEKELNNLGIPNVEFVLEDSSKCGVLGKHMKVLVKGQEEMDSEAAHEREDFHNHEHNHEHIHESVHSDGHSHEHEESHHHHNKLYDIEDIIENLNLSKEIKSDIREVFQLLAEAESKVHGEPISEIHFHEVGNYDAIADIAAVCYLMHELDVDKVVFSPINVGGGTVKCAHGILPVPAPATALLLEGIPSYESETIKSELCTPTGAALAKYFAFDFNSQPVMTVRKIGYGMGKKDFRQGNFVRAIYGECSDEYENDQIVELSCNIDDMTPEEIGFATEQLFAAGAVEVYTIPADMKKNRPGVILSCMCQIDNREKMLKVLFKHTTTIGVRESICNRYVLSRKIDALETPYGKVRVKEASGYDVKRKKLEYDDISGIARRTGKSIFEIKEELQAIMGASD
ncbi:MAG: nickel pincer cofactor biosynthesis protein LarC [Butyrivibrio sp.]|uniref:nickel pincer cofactor biosynthesis protein LarC n=1 Tax=Butyrivibrio sp. TaxID=28121 RepID=UPI001B1FB0BB|nr:nickel pincer cofactor biosynthesis protein LarC [Butyrivibrio sp.]MBO6241841.1 nickel pincer cofactor biosynthesis protein LarC [Butyrivibrio sp.]